MRVLRDDAEGGWLSPVPPCSFLRTGRSLGSWHWPWPRGLWALTYHTSLGCRSYRERGMGPCLASGLGPSTSFGFASKRLDASEPFGAGCFRGGLFRGRPPYPLPSCLRSSHFGPAVGRRRCRGPCFRVPDCCVRARATSGRPALQNELRKQSAPPWYKSLCRQLPSQRWSQK